MTDLKIVYPDFKKGGGMIPVVVQDYTSLRVLMLAYMNHEAWDETLKTGKAVYYSRSRKKLWVKGETSGHYQIVKNIYVDCDRDTILLKVKQIGKAACHLGYESCFFTEIKEDKKNNVSEDFGSDYKKTFTTQINETPVFHPEKVYTKEISK